MREMVREEKENREKGMDIEIKEGDRDRVKVREGKNRGSNSEELLLSTRLCSGLTYLVLLCPAMLWSDLNCTA